MDVEEKYTRLIENRSFSAFPAYAMRMWNYGLVNTLTNADCRQLKSDYGFSFYTAQLSGIAAVFYWNIRAMNIGFKAKWPRVKWTVSSYMCGALMSLPWSYYLHWCPVSRAFVTETSRVTVSEWMHPTGIIKHPLLPNPPPSTSSETTATDRFGQMVDFAKKSFS